MNNINTGGPAFPRVVEQPNGYMKAVEGMTLRDYFAAKALQGMLGDAEIRQSWSMFAKDAYEIADAMLKQRGESK